MLTKFKLASLRTGLFICALTLGACSSSPSSSTGAGGTGGSADAAAGTTGTDAAAGTTGTDAAAGTTGTTDGAAGTSGTTDGAAGTSGDGAAGQSASDINLSIINATTTGGLDPTVLGTPAVYATCKQ
jgi:penicillin amidase